TNPYTVQQNGVAERMNRTLLEKFRCLLISSGLQKPFWGEVVLTVAYLINLSPSVPLLGKSPETVWSGVKGYRLWVRSKPGFKVIISRDVMFNENEMPCLSKLEIEQKDTTFNKVEDNQKGGDILVEENIDEQNIDVPIENDETPLDNYQLARDRSRREQRILSRLKDFQVALNIKNFESSNIDKALKSKEWLSAMNEEMKSLKDNHTWDLVPKPKTCSLVDCK
ncbi:UNVERIFIED_CONTAM: Retrovirus-related Pol polyprotein from transposon TNT 1-94, partial [Sesamum indicum]